MKHIFIVLLSITVLSLSSACGLVSKEINEAYGNLTNKLEIKAEVMDSTVEADYRTLIGILDAAPERKALGDSLKIAYQEYQVVLSLLANTSSFVWDSLSGIDPETGEIANRTAIETNIPYWFGDNPAANDLRGNGQAFVIRETINKLKRSLGHMNQELGIMGSGKEAFHPPLLEDLELNGAEKSWERYTFDAPLIANMAVLEAIKLDVHEVFANEISFVRQTIDK